MNGKNAHFSTSCLEALLAGDICCCMLYILPRFINESIVEIPFDGDWSSRIIQASGSPMDLQVIWTFSNDSASTKIKRVDDSLKK